MKDKKGRVAFLPRSSGACEALLYEFTGHYRSSTPKEPIYLRRWRPDFEVLTGAACRLDYFAFRIAIGLSRFPGIVELHGWQYSPSGSLLKSNWRPRC
jgi:hypothetical protein